MLSRDQLLTKVRSLRRERLHVPEWDVEIFVREMTVEDRQRHLNVLRAAGDKPLPLDTYARIVVACVVDHEGKQVFNDADVAELTSKSGGLAVERIYKVVERLSFLGKAGHDDAKKNSEATPS